MTEPFVAEPPHDQIVIPKPIVYMMVALALFAIVACGLARWAQMGVTREDTRGAGRSVSFRLDLVGKGPVVATRSDGKRVVLAADHQEIFPRLIVEGIMTLRHRDGVPEAAPVRLDVGPDGQRLLVDTATGHTLRLAAFGYENGAAFDALLS